MTKFFIRILKFSGPYRNRVLSAAVFAFIKGVCVMMPLFLGFLMFSSFYDGTITIRSCWNYLLAMVVTVLLNIAATRLSDQMQSTAGYKIFADKRIALGEKLRKLPMGFFTAGNIGRISSVLSSDMVFVEENVMQSIAEMLSNAFTAIVINLFMFFIDWRIGLLTSVVSLLVVISAHFMNASSLRHAAIRQKQNEKLTDAVISHIEGIGIIKSYNLTGEKSKELTENIEETYRAALRYESSQVPWMVLHNALYTAGITGVIVLAFILFASGTITLPYLIGAMLFAFSIFVPLKTLYAESSRLTVMASCLDRIEALFEERTLPDEGRKHIEAVTEGPEIEFRHVSFSYEDKNLLARFWDINNGSIMVRGVDIRDLPLSELMKQISMVFQRVYLFQDTVYANIVMGRPDATKEEVIEACQKARCYDFIMSLPDGFDTIIGEGGASLSGGEKQRISIARCILKDAPIVILDEATASIDLDNERYIQEAISELVKGKTLIVIAHRLNTIMNADQIIVISDGRIAEKGTHDSLLAENGLYTRFLEARGSSQGW